jgi:hypothetical protein
MRDAPGSKQKAHCTIRRRIRGHAHTGALEIKQMFNLSKTESLPNNILKFSSYLTGNTLRLHYKHNRLMLFRETVAAYCENYKEYTRTLAGRIQSFSILQ